MVGRSVGTGVAAAGTGVGAAGATTQLASSDAVVAPSSPKMSRRLIVASLASCSGGHLACQKILLLAESQLSRRIRAPTPGDHVRRSQLSEGPPIGTGSSPSVTHSSAFRRLSLRPRAMRRLRIAQRFAVL